MANCPNCDAVLDVEDDELDEGDELTCEECGTNIVVASSDPLELEVADEDEEADEEDDEDDDDLDEDMEDEEDEEEDWK